MRRVLLPLVLLWLGLPLLRAADAPDQPLTLRQVLELLEARNPVLASGRAHLRATQANEITAALRPNPVVTSTNEDFNIFNPSRFDFVRSQEFTQSIAQTIERGQKRRFRTESARWSTQLTASGLADTRRQLQFAVKNGFVVMLLAKTNLQLAEDNLRDYRETVRLNEIRLKGGDISALELNRIRLEQARFESDALNARLALAQARVQLQSLLGFTRFSEPFEIDGSLEAPELPQSLADLQALALVHRPDYLAAVAGVSKAQTDVRLAEANGATDIVMGSEFKRNGPDNTIGFTVSLPLRIFDRNQGEKLRTRRELEASQSARQAAEVQVLGEVAQAYEAYRLSLARAQLYSRDYLQRAREVRERTAFSYRQGGATLLDYLDAVRVYRDVELAWRAANAQLLNAVHQLSFATGTELVP